MSTKVVSDDNSTGSAGSGSSESVSREAHDRLLAQRKADRARAQAAEEERDRLKAQAEEADAARIAAEKRFQEGWEAEKKRREAAEARVTQLTQAQTDAAKRSALASAIGGVKKSEFLGFADLTQIAVNSDGTIDEDSVKHVANKFRETYPELLVVSTTSKLPNGAARDVSPPAIKQPHEMSEDEKIAAYRALRGAK